MTARILACGAGWLTLSGVPQAMPATATERAVLFASCAGRYAAEAEHMALLDGRRADRAARREATFEALAGASAVSGPDFAMRAEAAHARLHQRMLLERARFGTDPRGRAAAEAASRRARETCDKLILDG